MLLTFASRARGEMVYPLVVFLLGRLEDSQVAPWPAAARSDCQIAAKINMKCKKR
jgi:hypothetical protein